MFKGGVKLERIVKPTVLISIALSDHIYPEGLIDLGGTIFVLDGTLIGYFLNSVKTF